MEQPTSKQQKKIRTLFSETLGDIDELDIDMDQDGITRIRGNIILNQVNYKVSITRSETVFHRAKNEGKEPTRKPLYSGTISIISFETNKVLLSETRRRKREEASRNAEGKDIYATIKYQCDSSQPTQIAAILRRQIDMLYSQNEDQLNAELMRWIQPEQLTPMLACQKYLGQFLSRAFPNSEGNPERSNQTIEVFDLLPSVPLSCLKAREVNKILESKHVSVAKAELCHRFSSFLLNNRYCIGSNPFPLQEKPEPTPEDRDRQAFSTYVLSERCFVKLVDFLNREISCLYCAVALLLSGFTLSEIVSFRWRDIEFLSPRDFAIVHFRKDELVAAIHDFSRPLIPDAALYLRRVYESLCYQYGEESVTGFYIASEDPTAGMQPDRKLISITAHDLLIRAGFVGRISSPGRTADDEDPAPIQIFRNNYHAALYIKAGLWDDPDTLSFLRGVLFQSSTYTNYESHTSIAAQKRLYTILKSISTEKKLSAIPESITEDGQICFTGTPRSNHEVVRVHGTVTLLPGQKLIMRCPHGVRGVVEKAPPDEVNFNE